MQLILISRCLLGETVRYDGGNKRLQHPLLELWQRQHRLVPICPEMVGGLPCPRPAAEIIGGDGQAVLSGQTQVLHQDGSSASDAFIRGAQAALELCQQRQIRFALLKARSPSCGIHGSYDGSFENRISDQGIGVTAALLRQHGIQLFDETQLDDLAIALSSDI
ncbi:MAG: DUF523 domain-containing protein [Halopseudomonas sp.]